MWFNIIDMKSNPKLQSLVESEKQHDLTGSFENLFLYMKKRPSLPESGSRKLVGHSRVKSVEIVAWVTFWQGQQTKTGHELVSWKTNVIILYLSFFVPLKSFFLCVIYNFLNIPLNNQIKEKESK